APNRPPARGRPSLPFAYSPLGPWSVDLSALNSHGYRRRIAQIARLPKARARGRRGHRARGIGCGLVRPQPSCYIRTLRARPPVEHATPHAVVAELVDALA